MVLPRNTERGDRFENIAFFGHPRNLADEFKQNNWLEDIEKLGLNWLIKSPARWHDYSDIDATLSVRSLQAKGFSNKPATKLYNSWLAGVPAILGCESAFQAKRKSELGYLKVKSYQLVIAGLQHLQVRNLEVLETLLIRAGVAQSLAAFQSTIDSEQ